MNKGPFFVVLFGLVAGFLLFLLGIAGFLPQSFYDEYHSVVGLLPGGGALPYMQKFEGGWSVSFIPRAGETDLGTCSKLDGTVYVHNGVFTGSIGSVSGPPIAFTATADIKGAVTGKIRSNAGESGTFEASVAGANGSGTWSDVFDCTGSLALSKRDPVVDPVGGHIVSFTGNPTLVRGGVTEPLTIGEQLYSGDIVQASGGSVILVGLGLYPQTVENGTEFTVSGAQ